jgi:predicted ATPase
MRQGLKAYQATGAEVGQPLHLAWLAQAYGSHGQITEGLQVLAEALAAAHCMGQQLAVAELLQRKGNLLLQQAVPDIARAEANLQQACTITHRLQAKSLALRAAMSLSRLWQQQGQREKARQFLAPIYRRFTEGFETADLQEAKALLKELECGW